LGGGGKRVPWTEIKDSNDWYIDAAFLVPGKTFGNPTLSIKRTIQAYWSHWYNLSQSNQPFTFKRTYPPHTSSSDEQESDKRANKRAPTEDGDEDSKRVPTEDGDEGSKRVPTSDEDEGGKRVPTDEEQDENKIEEATPARCCSDEEKVGFLRALADPSDRPYLSVIATLAPMKVSP
jgi:hypothetical protein